MRRILINTTASPLTISDINVTIEANAQREITGSELPKFIGSIDLLILIRDEVVVVNNGTQNLSSNDGVWLVFGPGNISSLTLDGGLNIESGRQSSANTTTTPLASSATFTGTFEQNDFSDVGVSCYSDTDGTLFFDFSVDGTNVRTFPPLGFPVKAGVHEFHTAVKMPRFFRLRFVNSASAQSTLQLYTYYGQFGQGNTPLNQKMSPDSDAKIVRFASEDEVMLGRYDGQMIISKFGRNPDIDTGTVPEDIWNGGGTYTGFPTATAEFLQVVSSSANDTAAGTGARTLRIFYLDANYNMFDANGDPLYVDVTLTGIVPVTTATQAMRVYRAYVLTSGTSQSNEGDITIRWAVTTATVFAVLPATFAQTQLSNFTVPDGWTGYMRRVGVSLADTTANTAQMVLRVREFNSNTFRNMRPFSVSTSASFERDYFGGLKFPEKTDVILRCTSVVNNNAVVLCDYAIHLVRND